MLEFNYIKLHIRYEYFIHSTAFAMLNFCINKYIFGIPNQSHLVVFGIVHRSIVQFLDFYKFLNSFELTKCSAKAVFFRILGWVEQKFNDPHSPQTGWSIWHAEANIVWNHNECCEHAVLEGYFERNRRDPNQQLRVREFQNNERFHTVFQVLS